MPSRVNISVPKELKEEMAKYPHLNWSKIAQEAFWQAVMLEVQDEKTSARLNRLRDQLGLFPDLRGLGQWQP